MKKEKRFKRKIYGIQARFLKYVLALLSLTILLSGVGIGTILNENVKRATIDTYSYVNERIAVHLESEFERTDELMKRCLESSEIQNSLLNSELSTMEMANLERALSYVDLKNLENYIYVDNKGNVYQQAYRNASYEKFMESGLKESLGEDYSTTKWNWMEDRIFDREGKYLFIGRYMRNMEFHHEPGMLFFQVNEGFFKDILKEASEEGIYLILDGKGKICCQEFRGKEKLTGKQKKRIETEIEALKGREQEEVRFHLNGLGTVICRPSVNSGFTAVTLVPASILNSAAVRTALVMACVYAVIILIAVIFSIYFSRRFTSPVKEISSAMKEFDGGDFSRELCIRTNTELDTIGNAFNNMVKNIEQLVTEIKENEQELRKSELNSLMYQINPHFLYNTLDTIYMLARINREETTMKMIQALSKFLKVSLSKGSDEIPVSDELEHVKSYMEIQKIRNNDLFQYEIICEDGLENVKILKLILQPLVENAIKHGFAKIYEDGEIRIRVFKKENRAVFHVANNGVPMSEEVRMLIDDMVKEDISSVQTVFTRQEGGYGVGNVISRLRLKYGDDITFYYTSDEQETCCIIEIPIQNGLEESV